MWRNVFDGNEHWWPQEKRRPYEGCKPQEIRCEGRTKIKKSMEEMKAGKLRSGRSGKKVTSRKQAVSIGLSEARRAGGKVPKPQGSRKKS